MIHEADRAVRAILARHEHEAADLVEVTFLDGAAGLPWTSEALRARAFDALTGRFETIRSAYGAHGLSQTDPLVTAALDTCAQAYGRRLHELLAGSMPGGRA